MTRRSIHDGWTPQPEVQVQPGDPWLDPEADAARTADRPSPEDWSRLLDYLEVNAPADVDDVIAVLEVRAHRAEKRAATPAWSDAGDGLDVERLSDDIAAMLHYRAGLPKSDRHEKARGGPCDACIESARQAVEFLR